MDRFTRMRTASSLLLGILFVLGVLSARPVQADGPFTNASLQGRYAYVNNTGNVASLGPVTFDGNGGITVKIIANLPCTNPAPNCSRTINDLPRADGSYSVEGDGTGVATINFSTGAVTYDFMISKSTKKGGTLFATEVFAAGQSGGLAGQLIAPTWSRILD